MKKNIVVMGGSFNPPTIAHLRTMQTALDAVNAERGFFVPVSFPYLKRKMVKAGQSHLCLSDDFRLKMLKAMIASDKRIQIYTEVMGNPYSNDVVLMGLIQDKYPDAEIFYFAGDDKLNLLENFARKSDFFDRFRCIICVRECGNLMDEISAHKHLAAYKDSFVIIKSPEGIEGISSTRIREHLFDIDTVTEMLHPDVIPLLRQLEKEDFPEEILQFKEDLAFLSNDFPAEITYEGISYPCVTSAFLASKTVDLAEKKVISKMNPVKAKQIYNAKQSVPEWEEKKTDIMEAIVRLKFQQHTDLKTALLSTGSHKLINGGKKDNMDLFWGVNLNKWEGKNVLGIILMKVRMEEKEYEIHKRFNHQTI